MKNRLVIKYLMIGCGLLAAFGGGVLLYPVVEPQIVAGQGGFDSPVLPMLANTESFPFAEDVMVPAADEEVSEDLSPALSYTAYRIKKGDMIGVIAEEFNLTQDTLISVNNIRKTRLIQPGQYLKIPSMPGILYTVREDGETLGSIAKKYEISGDKCAQVNNLALEAALSAGTTLFLPDAEMDWVTRQEINGDLFQRPIKGRYYFSSYFGWRKNPFTGARTYHGGIDMAANTGTAVYAALEGTVIEAGYNNTYGNYVVIRHHSGYQTLYGHLNTINTKRGRYVYTNTKIGTVGSTGMSTGPHLHFAVYKNGKGVNPQNLWN